MDNCKKWCSVCYHNNRNTIGICDTDTIHQHEHTNSPLTKWFNVTFKNNTPHLFDEVPCQPPDDSAFEEAEIFLRHEKREEDIVNRIENNTAYAIAFYKKPLRSAYNNYDWSLSTLWSTYETDALHVVRIADLIDIYPLLLEKLKREYPNVMDDVYNRSPANLNQMTFKRKALQIIREIKLFNKWIKPFLHPVKEDEDCAPNYYKIITNPMDIGSLVELIDNETITSALEFVSKLTSIWSNAQKFNPAQHRVHECANHCKREATRLITKYFPHYFRKSNSSQYPLVDYHNGIRRSLSCRMCTSNSKLSFLIGFHRDCARLEPKRCIQCKVTLKDTSIAYYHCVSGCQSNEHSVFLCETCAAKDYDSKQIESLPFNGLWVSLGTDTQDDFFYEALLCRQDANRVFFKLIFHTNADVDGSHDREEEAMITCSNHEEMEFKVDSVKIVNTVCRLSSDHSRISFINPKNTADTTDVNTYDKVMPRCRDCNSILRIMQKDTTPLAGDLGRYRHCDVHEQYYEDAQTQTQYISRNAFVYDESSKKAIPRVAFYYTCVKCNNFDICAGCILIKVEKEWKNKQECNLEPRVAKKRKRAYSPSPAPSHKKRKIKSKTVAKKPKICSMTVDRKRKRNKLENADTESYYKELYLREKEKNETLSLQLNESQKEALHYKSKFYRLHSKIGQVLCMGQPQAPQPPL